MSELLALQETLYTSRNPTRRWLHRTRRERIEAALRRVAGAGGTGRALEVGPGSGVYLPLLCELFDEVVASDVEEAFLDQARELAKAHRTSVPVADDITATPARARELRRGALLGGDRAHRRLRRARSPAMRALLRPAARWCCRPRSATARSSWPGRIAFLPGVVQVVRRVYREPILATGHINLLRASRRGASSAGAGFQVLESLQSGVYLPLVAEFTGGRAP